MAVYERLDNIYWSYDVILRMVRDNSNEYYPCSYLDILWYSSKDDPTLGYSPGRGGGGGGGWLLDQYFGLGEPLRV